MANARMIGGHRFLMQARKYRLKREASMAAKRLRDRGFLSRVTHESDGMYAVWQGPKR